VFLGKTVSWERGGGKAFLIISRTMGEEVYAPILPGKELSSEKKS